MLITNSKPSATKFTDKMLVVAATVLGAGLVAAAPAVANPEPSDDTHPINPFAGLTCTCQETTPAGSADRNSELDRGIRAGSHGQALSTQPTQ